MISWKPRTHGLRPIGLDIGHDSIKMIQLAVKGGEVDVIAASRARIDSGIKDELEERRSFVISAIGQMLTNGNFRGRNVVSCLPNERLKITSLRLAAKEDGEIEEVLRKEVAQRFGLNPDKDAMDYLVAGNVLRGDEIKNELILFAADNDAIRSHINMLEEAQLRPAAIDTIPCALFRSFERSLRRQEDRERTAIFVDVGSRFTTVVFGRRGEINFIKQIAIGGKDFNQEIASKLGVGVSAAAMLRNKLRMERTPKWFRGPRRSNGGQSGLDTSTRQAIVDAITGVAEKLAKELSLCFRYYTVTFRGSHIGRAIFAGGEAYEDILLDVLKRQFMVDIEIAEPLRGFERGKVDFGGNGEGPLCEWAVAVGLSLKGLDGNCLSGGYYEGN